MVKIGGQEIEIPTPEKVFKDVFGSEEDPDTDICVAFAAGCIAWHKEMCEFADALRKLGLSEEDSAAAVKLMDDGVQKNAEQLEKITLAKLTSEEMANGHLRGRSDFSNN